MYVPKIFKLSKQKNTHTLLELSVLMKLQLQVIHDSKQEDNFSYYFSAKMCAKYINSITVIHAGRVNTN